MSELRTLKDIFETEPDDAQVYDGCCWETVGQLKKLAWNWQWLCDRKFRVKRKPRAFEILRRPDGTPYVVGEIRDSDCVIKVVEVLDE